jgi:ribosomal protein S18 acetylase RimI-like enzyme
VDESVIQAYQETHRESVLDVLAEAYATTPISVALVGGTSDQQRRQVRILFDLRFPTMSGEKLVAVHRGRVVGFAHWLPHPASDASPMQLPSGAESLLATLSEGVLPRLAALVREWRRHDLEVPHSHLGPIAVAPSFQGVGIARRFLQRYCADLEARNEIAYLETDRSENVRLFSGFGFMVTSEIEIVGVKNWFMMRRVQ